MYYLIREFSQQVITVTLLSLNICCRLKLVCLPPSGSASAPVSSLITIWELLRHFPQVQGQTNISQSMATALSPSANTHGCCQTNRVCYKYKSEMFCPIEMANSLFYSSKYFWYLNIPVKYCCRIGHGRFNCCLWCVTFPISYSRFYLVSHSSGHYCFLSKRISFLSVIMADKTPTKLWFSL